MNAQSISTPSVEFLSSSKTGKTSGTSKSNSVSDFGKVMDEHTKTEDSNKKSSSQVDRKKDKVEASNDVKAAATETDVAEPQKAQNTSSSSSVEDNQVNQATISKSGTDLQSTVDKISEKIESTVLSALDITKEQLDKIMETLGLNMLDLLNPNNLNQLVLQVNGSSDISEALTDENLANMIQNLQQKLGDLQLNKEFQMSTEEMTNLLNSKMDATPTSNAGAVVNEQALKESDFKIPDQKESSTSDKNLLLNDNLQSTKVQDLNIKVQDVNSNDKGTEDTTSQKEILIRVDKTSSGMTENSGLSDNTSSKDNQAKTELPTPIENFVNNLVAATNDDNQNFTTLVTSVRQMQDITNQVVEQIKVTIKPEQTSMELQLNPDNLGKLTLAVSEKNGVLTAHFTAQTEIAKEAIESQMQVLKENLNNQGLKVESIEVTVSDFSFNQSNQAGAQEQKQENSQKQHLFRSDSELYGSQPEEESLATINQSQTSSSIDFTA